jgi:hypothetical protein
MLVEARQAMLQGCHPARLGGRSGQHLADTLTLEGRCLVIAARLAGGDESANELVRQHDLRSRPDDQPIHLGLGALAGRIVTLNGGDPIIGGKPDAIGMRSIGRKQIDYLAAKCNFARLVHTLVQYVAGSQDEMPQFLAAQHVVALDGQRRLWPNGTGGDSLHERLGRRDQQAAAGECRFSEPDERRDPVAHHSRRRRAAVERQAVPGGQQRARARLWAARSAAGGRVDRTSPD